MHNPAHTVRPLAVAVSLALLQRGVAHAQNTPAQPAETTSPEAAKDGLKLDQIVITGTAGGRSKMRSSVSSAA